MRPEIAPVLVSVVTISDPLGPGKGACYSGGGSASPMTYGTARGGRSRTASRATTDRKSTRLNSSHLVISYAVFCLKKKKRHLAATTCAHCVYRRESVTRPTRRR